MASTDPQTTVDQGTARTTGALHVARAKPSPDPAVLVPARLEFLSTHGLATTRVRIDRLKRMGTSLTTRPVSLEVDPVTRPFAYEGIRELENGSRYARRFERLRKRGLTSCTKTLGAIAARGSGPLIPARRSSATVACASACACAGGTSTRTGPAVGGLDSAPIAWEVLSSPRIPTLPEPSPDFRPTRDEYGQPVFIDLQFDARVFEATIRQKIESALYASTVCVQQQQFPFPFRASIGALILGNSPLVPSTIDRITIDNIALIRRDTGGVAWLSAPNPNPGLPAAIWHGDRIPSPQVDAQVDATVYVVAMSDLQTASGSPPNSTQRVPLRIRLTTTLSVSASGGAALVFTPPSIGVTISQAPVSRFTRFTPLGVLVSSMLIPQASVNAALGQLTNLQAIPIDVSTLTSSLGRVFYLWNAGIDLRTSPSRRTVTLRLAFGLPLADTSDTARGIFERARNLAYHATERAMWVAFYRDGAPDRIPTGSDWSVFLDARLLSQTFAQTVDQIQARPGEAPPRVTTIAGSGRSELTYYSESRTLIPEVRFDFDVTVHRACISFFDLDLNAQVHTRTNLQIVRVERTDPATRVTSTEIFLRAELTINANVFAGDALGCGVASLFLGWAWLLTLLFGAWIFPSPGVIGEPGSSSMPPPLDPLNSSNPFIRLLTGVVVTAALTLIPMFAFASAGDVRIPVSDPAVATALAGAGFTQPDPSVPQYRLDVPLGAITSALPGLQIDRFVENDDGLVIVGALTPPPAGEPQLDLVTVTEDWRPAPLQGCQQTEMAPELVLHSRNIGTGPMFICGLSSSGAVPLPSGVQFSAFAPAFTDATLIVPLVRDPATDPRNASALAFFVPPGGSFDLRIRMTRRGLAWLESQLRNDFAIPGPAGSMERGAVPGPVGGFPSQPFWLRLQTTGGTRLIGLPVPTELVLVADLDPARQRLDDSCARRASLGMGVGMGVGMGAPCPGCDASVLAFIPRIAEQPAGGLPADATTMLSTVADLSRLSTAGTAFVSPIVIDLSRGRGL